MYKNITNYVVGLGIRPTTKGFRYIIDAIAISLKDDKVKLNMYKDIYSAIAKKYKDKPSNVERAMRHAIENCNDKEKKAMSNGMFLATIKLENNIKGEK